MAGTVGLVNPPAGPMAAPVVGLLVVGSGSRAGWSTSPPQSRFEPTGVTRTLKTEMTPPGAAAVADASSSTPGTFSSIHFQPMWTVGWAETGLQATGPKTC